MNLGRPLSTSSTAPPRTNTLVLVIFAAFKSENECSRLRGRSAVQKRRRGRKADSFSFLYCRFAWLSCTRWSAVHMVHTKQVRKQQRECYNYKNSILLLHHHHHHHLGHHQKLFCKYVTNEIESNTFQL